MKIECWRGLDGLENRNCMWTIPVAHEWQMVPLCHHKSLIWRQICPPAIWKSSLCFHGDQIPLFGWKLDEGYGYGLLWHGQAVNFCPIPIRTDNGNCLDRIILLLSFLLYICEAKVSGEFRIRITEDEPPQELGTVVPRIMNENCSICPPPKKPPRKRNREGGIIKKLIKYKK